MSKQTKTQKVYVKIDRKIKEGDLVRFVKDDDSTWGGSYKKGNIRKASCDPYGPFEGGNVKLVGGGTALADYLEPVRRVRIGDKVRIVHDKNPKIKENIGVVVKNDGSAIPLLVDIGQNNRWKKASEVVYVEEPSTADEPQTEQTNTEPTREGMQKLVCDMLCELMQTAEQKHDVIHLWNTGTRTTVQVGFNKPSVAMCSPHDTFDRLTGLFVALCKATGRPLPPELAPEQKKEQPEEKPEYLVGYDQTVYRKLNRKIKVGDTVFFVKGDVPKHRGDTVHVEDVVITMFTGNDKKAYFIDNTVPVEKCPDLVKANDGKIYRKLNREIRRGDTVYCLEYDVPCGAGDTQVVSKLDRERWFFCAPSEMLMRQRKWVPVELVQ